ncbi:MAG: aspartate ammonia-lyase [Agathobacter sp.]|uniref:aspartate ammonia-lyase n=1 Tax=Agathobacter sp. TaxID=2021311 RepID=UPI002E798220|nr:aspartate ammonia-lyase [Agathobacter sp.]MEE1216133.1 aspartate ammonia-lyase [Agathobacter sp.]
MTEYMRLESDSIGEMEVPGEAYYGVQALRANENFPITGNSLNPDFIKNMARIKRAAAITNMRAGRLKPEIANAIESACNEVVCGMFASEFIVDGIQGGAGTSANMNMNEVIANRAIEMLCGKKGDYSIVHPNDHVNMAQSTNDVIPTAGKLTVLDLLKKLEKSLKKLDSALYKKADEFDGVIKIGRTQLEDAVPMRLGQSFHAYATMIERDIDRIAKAKKEMYTVNMGATAIGTGINTSEYYFDHIVPTLAKVSGYPLVQADDLFDATENLDGFVRVSSCLKACAVNLSKMCNDLRILASGPKAGFGEITLPAMQNGSSIMPGKVNPVIPEVVSQVAFHIIGHDVTITMAAEAGQMELNAFEPVVFYNLFDSITTLTHAVDTLTDNCIIGITANEERCQKLLDASVGITTALCPYIGYKKAASLAKESLRTGVPVKKLVLKHGLMKEKQLDIVLDPYAMTEAATKKSKAKVG